VAAVSAAAPRPPHRPRLSSRARNCSSSGLTARDGPLAGPGNHEHRLMGGAFSRPRCSTETTLIIIRSPNTYAGPRARSEQ
jgi:hypothetical protein